MKLHALSIVPLMVLALGCQKGKKNDDAQATAQAIDQATTTEAKSEYGSAQYELKLVAPSSISKGKQATFDVVLVTKGAFHINDEYPYRFTCDTRAEGVKYPKPKLGRKDGTFGKTRAVISVPFIPQKSGTVRLGGDYRFSVCSAQNCLMKRK